MHHPKVFLLHDLSNCFDLQGHKIIIMNALVAAKILVASYWKILHLPTKIEWLMKMRFNLLMNKLTAIIINYTQGAEKTSLTFVKCWSPFINYWNQNKPTQATDMEVLQLL